MSDRTFERAALDWLEDGSDRTPPTAIDAVLLAVKTTPQERELRLSWRPKTMFERLAVAAAIAVVAIGTLTLGAALLVKPNEPAAGTCPRTFSEADAVDTFAGLAPSERAWGTAFGVPGQTRPGLMAAFAWDTVDGPQSVVTIDPATSKRCTLIRFADHKLIRSRLSVLDWSPSGDALAVALENPEDPAADGDPSGQTGQVLLWTPTRLLRIWAGPGQAPGIAWAPDGRAIAVWIRSGADSDGAHVILADGSADRNLGVKPSSDLLRWSPDGSRLLVSEWLGEFRGELVVKIVNVADGRQTPIPLDIESPRAEGWLDDERVLVSEFTPERAYRYLELSLATPDRFSVVPLPDAALHDERDVVFSPDLGRAAYVTADGHLEIVTVPADAGISPVRVETNVEYRPGLGWADDGSRVFFTQDLASPETGADYGIWAVNPDGTDLRQIASGDVWAIGHAWQPVPVR